MINILSHKFCFWSFLIRFLVARDVFVTWVSQSIKVGWIVGWVSGTVKHWWRPLENENAYRTSEWSHNSLPCSYHWLFFKSRHQSQTLQWLSKLLQRGNLDSFSIVQLLRLGLVMSKQLAFHLSYPEAAGGEQGGIQRLGPWSVDWLSQAHLHVGHATVFVSKLPSLCNKWKGCYSCSIKAEWHSSSFSTPRTSLFTINFNKICINIFPIYSFHLWFLHLISKV